MKRKIFSLLLSIAMIMTMLPLTVGAKAANPNQEILNPPSASLGNVTISESATRDSKSNEFNVTFKVERKAVQPSIVDRSINIPELYLLTIPFEKNILLTKAKELPFNASYDKNHHALSWIIALKVGESATLSYKVQLSANKNDLGKDIAYYLNSKDKTILSFGCKEKLLVNVPTVKYSWPTLFTRGYLVNEKGQLINKDGKPVLSFRDAVIVYDETPVINPKVNKNEWLYGPHDVSANKVFGYTLTDKSPKQICLSVEKPKGVAYFAYTLNKNNYTVEYYFEDSAGKFNKNDALSKTGDFKLNETKKASDFALKDVPTGFIYDPKNTNAVNTISYTEGSKTGNVLKLYYKQKAHTLTIHYVDKNGKDMGSAAPTYTDSSKHYTDPFSVTSPKINGFKADKAVIEGKMPDDNAEFTVTYTAIPSPSSSSAQPTAIVNNTVPKSNSPQTGDSGSFVLASMLLAAVSLTGIVVCKKRKTK